MLSSSSVLSVFGSMIKQKLLQQLTELRVQEQTLVNQKMTKKSPHKQWCTLGDSNSNENIQQKMPPPILASYFCIYFITSFATSGDQHSRCLWEVSPTFWVLESTWCKQYKRRLNIWKEVDNTSYLLFSCLDCCICMWFTCIRKPYIYMRVFRHVSVKC